MDVLPSACTGPVATRLGIRTRILEMQHTKPKNSERVRRGLREGQITSLQGCPNYEISKLIRRYGKVRQCRLSCSVFPPNNLCECHSTLCRLIQLITL